MDGHRTPMRVRRLLRWARNGMRGLIIESDMPIIAEALELLLAKCEAEARNKPRTP